MDQEAAPPTKFYIRSQYLDNLALSVVDGKVMVTWLNPGDPRQQFDVGGIPPTARIINVASRGPVGVVKVERYEHLVLESHNNTWIIDGQENPHTVLLAGSSELVIEIEGPYDLNSIGIHAVLMPRNDREPKQKWILTPVNSLPQPETVQVMISGVQHAIYDDGSRLVFGTYDPADPRYKFMMTRWWTGVSFQNKATGKFFGCYRDNAPVFRQDGLSPEMLWQFEATRQADWSRLHLMLEHGGMYLKGGGSGRTPEVGDEVEVSPLLPAPDVDYRQTWNVSRVSGE